MPNARGDQAKLLARRQSTFGAAEAAARPGYNRNASFTNSHLLHSPNSIAR